MAGNALLAIQKKPLCGAGVPTEHLCCDKETDLKTPLNLGLPPSQGKRAPVLAVERNSFRFEREEFRPTSDHSSS
jgi:hypothetical protein